MVNPRTTESRRFRRRFWLPFPVFQHLVQLCTRENIFKSVSSDTNRIKNIKLSLHTWSRQLCWWYHWIDSTNMRREQSFVEGMGLLLYPKVCKFASGNLFQQVVQIYAKLGLPMCVGSMDCTRIKWIMYTERTRWHRVGKEGWPTMIFLVIVDHKHRVQYCSGFLKELTMMFK